MVYALLILFTLFGQAMLATPKTVYVVGGWLPGTPENMLKALKPLFEDYLNTHVGNFYSPRISFQLKPVDFSPETDSDSLVQNGAIDFLCEFDVNDQQLASLLKIINFRRYTWWWRSVCADPIPMDCHCNSAYSSRKCCDRSSRKCNLFLAIEHSNIQHFRLQGQTYRAWIYSFTRFLPARESGMAILLLIELNL